MLTESDVTKWASYQWGYEEGLKLAKKELMEEDFQRTLCDIARKLLPEMDDQRIAKITGLPLKEVQALRDSPESDHK